MIIINDTRFYVLYVRTNRRVQWRYSEYDGRYETLEQAIEKAKERFGSTHTEYYIENRETGEAYNGKIS